MARFKTSSVSVILLSAALLHCGKEATSEPRTPAPGPETASTPPTSGSEQMTPASGTAPAPEAAPAAAPTTATPTPAPLTDEQIAMVMDLANTAEVEQAKFAQTKAKSAKVKNYAAMMINHHGKAKDKGSKLTTKLNMKPAESPTSTQLKSDTDAMMSSLKSAGPADFDRAYIASQVDAHQKVLSTLDEQLIPNAKDAELKALLQEMRSTVDSHLKEAQKIQNELGATAPGSPGTASGGTEKR